MSLQNASGTQNQHKRVRIDPTAATIPDTSNTTTATSRVPKAHAKATIAANTATLLKPLATILENLGTKHLDLLHRLHNKSTQLSRMRSDDTIIPRSCRLKFELAVPRSVQELPDFLQLVGETNTDIDKMKLQLKLRVLQALEIEIKVFHAELNDHLSVVIHRATAAMLISLDMVNLNPHRVVAHLLSTYNEDLLKHIPATLDEFKTLYVKTHTLPAFPSINAPSSTPPPLINTSRFFTQPDNQPVTQEVVAEEIPNLDLINRNLCSFFIAPFTSYLQQERENEINLRMKKFVEEELTVQATTDAQMAVEAEESVSRELLNELVLKETKKNTSKLQSEVNSLKQALHALKDPRGRPPPGGASTKRNSSATKKATKATQRNAGAAARRQGSSESTKNNNAKKKKKTTKKKQPPSSTKKK